MNELGAIDAVMTSDSDVFVFGAQLVLSMYKFLLCRQF